MAVRHFVITHGNNRARVGGHRLARTAGVVSIAIHNQSTNATFASSVIYAQPNSTASIPITFLNGADASCISVTSGTVVSANLEVAVGLSDLTITIADTKVLVTATNQFTAGITSISPTSQFVPINTAATISLQYAGGYSANDVKVSAGSVNGTIWSIPVETSPVSATIVEESKVLVEVDNQFAEGVASLSPLSQYVYINSVATVNVQFNSGYSAADVKVSAGSISGTTWSIPVTSGPVTATISTNGPEPLASITIAGRTYPVVQIGSQYWMADNLRYLTADSMYYTNGDTDKYGRYYSVNDIRTTIPALLASEGLSEWHVPSIDEMNQLINFVGSDTGYGKSGVAKALFKTSEFSQSDDRYGFGLVRNGFYNNRWLDVDNYALLGEETPGNNYANRITLFASTSGNPAAQGDCGSAYSGIRMGVRLVRNI